MSRDQLGHSGNILLPPVQQQPKYGCFEINPAPTTTANIVLISDFGPEVQVLKCPFCHHFVSTRVKSKANVKTHLWALLAFVSFCWACCFCPYCIDSCMDRHHYCSHCSAYLGSYRS